MNTTATARLCASSRRKPGLWNMSFAESKEALMLSGAQAGRLTGFADALVSLSMESK